MPTGEIKKAFAAAKPSQQNRQQPASRWSKRQKPPKKAGRGPTITDVVRAYYPAWVIGRDKTRPHVCYAAKALIAAVGQKSPRDVTATDVGEIIHGWRSYSLGTRYARAQGLRRLLIWLFEEHGGPNLHRNFPKLETPSPRNVTVRDSDRLALFATAAPHLRCWLLLCSDLAIRSTTAAEMRPRHYDHHARTLTFPTKKGREMCLPVTAEIAGVFGPLANLDPDTPFVCHLHPWGHIGATNLRMSLARLRRSLGINRRITPHDFRRTTAVAIYDQSHDLRIVQAVLGHRNLSATLHYLDHRNTPVDPSTLELAKLAPLTKGIQ